MLHEFDPAIEFVASTVTSVFKMSTTPETATIRRATADDAAALAELGAATFVETFGHLYPTEDLQTFLARSHTQES